MRVQRNLISSVPGCLVTNVEQFLSRQVTLHVVLNKKGHTLMLKLFGAVCDGVRVGGDKEAR